MRLVWRVRNFQKFFAENAIYEVWHSPARAFVMPSLSLSMCVYVGMYGESVNKLFVSCESQRARKRTLESKSLFCLPSMNIDRDKNNIYLSRFVKNDGLA